MHHHPSTRTQRRMAVLFCHDARRSTTFLSTDCDKLCHTAHPFHRRRVCWLNYPPVVRSWLYSSHRFINFGLGYSFDSRKDGNQARTGCAMCVSVSVFFSLNNIHDIWNVKFKFNAELSGRSIDIRNSIVAQPIAFANIFLLLSHSNNGIIRRWVRWCLRDRNLRIRHRFGRVARGHKQKPKRIRMSHINFRN